MEINIGDGGFKMKGWKKCHVAKPQTPNAGWRGADRTYLHFKSEGSFERVLEIKIPRFHWGRTNFGSNTHLYGRVLKPRKVFLMEMLTSLSTHTPHPQRDLHFLRK